ncbi:unnamed protein product, partial [Mesorhabditis spiculigera]
MSVHSNVPWSLSPEPVQLIVERIPDDFSPNNSSEFILGSNKGTSRWYRQGWMPLLLIFVVLFGCTIFAVVVSIIIASQRLSAYHHFYPDG